MDPLIIAFICIALLLIWSITLTVLLTQTRRHYHSLTEGITQKDLTTSLNQILKRLERNQKDIEDVSNKLKSEIERGKTNYKHLGFKRFNPFTDTGGDQSFVLCLLDETNSGFVISSLHSRENTRIYAKKVVSGACPDQVLSKEEQEVISKALNNL
jgi:hypothetical protein